MKHFHIWVPMWSGNGWRSFISSYRCSKCGKVKPS